MCMLHALHDLSLSARPGGRCSLSLLPAATMRSDLSCMSLKIYRQEALHKNISLSLAPFHPSQPSPGISFHAFKHLSISLLTRPRRNCLLASKIVEHLTG